MTSEGVSYVCLHTVISVRRSVQSCVYLIDVDECGGEEPGPCGLHASCNNTPGSYSCSCLRGYLMGAGGCQGLPQLCVYEAERMCSMCVSACWEGETEKLLSVPFSSIQ